MNLVSIRIITADVNKLLGFYEQVTGIAGVKYTEDFAEILSESATLAIGSTRTLAFFGGGEVAEAAHNRSAIVEFMVNDVDAIYNSIAGLVQPTLIQGPTTMPWGNRSLLFRDPDGNLVNFFTPVSPDAIKKFSR